MQTQTSLRKYQERACEIATNRSCIVILPTGAGKTLIASAVAWHTSSTTNGKVLFLVPTRLLVNQQAKAVRSETGLHVAEYMGSSAVPTQFDILVSTPSAFLVLNDTNSRFQFHHFQLIIFDEVHHVVKRHPFRTIARRLSSLTIMPKILGLSASLTYAMGAKGIESAISELCLQLRMSGSCIFTATNEELARDGYHATCTQTEVNLAEDNEDVLGSMDATDSLKIPGQVHTGLTDFLSHIDSRRPPIHELSIVLMDTIRLIETKISQVESSFISPIGLKGKKGNVAAWGEYAFGRRMTLQNMKNATQLSSLIAAYFQLQHLYEAARLVINSRQCRLELAFHYLVMTGVLKNNIDDEITDVHSDFLSLQLCWNSNCTEFCSMSHLKVVLENQRARFGGTLRCIVFVQQRVTTHILKHFLDYDAELQYVKCDVIYATSSPATAELSVTASQARERLSQFASGHLNVIIATSVAEEGMDIPAANCVIRFDPVQTPVSLVQSRGRARQQDSAFVIMKEESTRSVHELHVAEQQQRDVIAAINRSGVKVDENAHQKLLQAQAARKRNARTVLDRYFAEPVGKRQSLATVNLYSQKVSGEITTHGSKTPSGTWQSVYALSQFGESTLSAQGVGQNKKEANHIAAANLLEQILSRV